jgi:hypothetical protein
MPDLVFFCELESKALRELFSNPNLIETLKSMHASISLGLLDLSSKRAEVVQKLNRAGIPVTAWLLLPRDEGYWFNLDNAPQAANRYGKFMDWTLDNDLHWEAIGLDIEPDINLMDQIATDPKRGIARLASKLFESRRHRHAEMAYTALISQMHTDGFFIESYQIPLIADERKARSTVIQRTLGILDLPVDREVFMLYSSLLPAYGAGLVNSYAGEPDAIALGSTGGGVLIEGIGELQAIGWDDLKRDLLLAAQYSKYLYVFSLEGCLRQGMLSNIRTMDWEECVPLPVEQTRTIDLIRRSGQGLAWTISHPLLVILGFLGLRMLFWKRKP